MNKEESKEIHNGPRNSIPKHFIPSGTNPDNSVFFGDLDNPLSSKGNSVIAEDYGIFQKGGANLEQ